jgi:tRNA dimethylallyltransferase
MVEDRLGRIGYERHDMVHGAIFSAKEASQEKRTAAGQSLAVIIAGPTASGKSGCALAVAEEFRGTIINADAMQLYRELAILTDRPGPAETARVPHRLYGVLAMDDPCSAGRWRDLALAEMEAAAAEGRLPILVGGTGLYLKAMLAGLAPVPQIPAEVRAETRARYEELGRAKFEAELARRDPGMTAMPKDKQRLIRACEVLAATGRPLRDWQGSPMDGAPGYRFATIVFDPPRAALYEAVDRRFERMMAHGALDEARRIAALNLDPGLPAMKAVGLRELLGHLSGEIELSQAVKAAQQASRNYAKRQVTWFRHQLPDAFRIAAQFSESLDDEIFSFIRGFC